MTNLPFSSDRYRAGVIGVVLVALPKYHGPHMMSERISLHVLQRLAHGGAVDFGRIHLQHQVDDDAGGNIAGLLEGIALIAGTAVGVENRVPVHGIGRRAYQAARARVRRRPCRPNTVL